MHRKCSRVPLSPEIEEQPALTEADGLTRAQADEEMIVETFQLIDDIDYDPETARDILREHLPPYLRRKYEGRIA